MNTLTKSIFLKLKADFPSYCRVGRAFVRCDDDLVAYGIFVELSPSFFRVYRYAFPLYSGLEMGLLSWSDLLPRAEQSRRKRSDDDVVDTVVKLASDYLGDETRVRTATVKDLTALDRQLLGRKELPLSRLQDFDIVPPAHRLTYAKGCLLDGDLEGCQRELCIAWAVSRCYGVSTLISTSKILDSGLALSRSWGCLSNKEAYPEDERVNRDIVDFVNVFESSPVAASAALKEHAIQRKKALGIG